jgi:hypothetical protein
MCRAIDYWTPSKARLDLDSILCVRWIVNFRKVVVNHVVGATISAAFVSKTSAIFDLRDLKASPYCRDFERATNAINREVKWVGKSLLGGELSIHIRAAGYTFNV